MIFLDQMPTAVEYLGIALVLAGVVIQQRDVLTQASESA
jgi:drug/metabolite transporter (DMT)-like permease